MNEMLEKDKHSKMKKRMSEINEGLSESEHSSSSDSDGMHRHMLECNVKHMHSQMQIVPNSNL